jgi:RNA polymerase sigma-70 factor, ECF subfamily
MELPGTLPTANHAPAGIHAGTVDFRDAFKQHQQALVNVAYRITNDIESARDMVQDTYATILENEGAFNGSSSLKTYLYRIVINKSIDFRRKRERRWTVLDAFGREQALTARRPEQDADTRDLVRKLLGEIPDKYRIPLLLAEVDGMSYEEIAETLRISTNAARTRVFRCREKMRKVLGQSGWLS